MHCALSRKLRVKRMKIKPQSNPKSCKIVIQIIE